MMTRFVYIFRFVLILALFLPLMSCEEKELCYYHPHGHHIRLLFDWSKAPEANPKGMYVYFYNLDDGSVSRYNFQSKDGGEVELREGHYNIITYNNDTEVCQFSSPNIFNEHNSFSRRANFLEPIYGNTIKPSDAAVGVENELVRLCPDALWGCTVTGLEFKDGDITLYPEDMLCHYSLEVRNVKNLKSVDAVCASISGMASSLSFSNLEPSGDTATFPFSVEESSPETLTGECLLFGNHSDASNIHRVMIYVVLKNGKKYAYGVAEPDFEVTSQVDNATDPKHVKIILDGLYIPEVISEGGGGMSVEIEDWVFGGDVNIEL